MMPVDHQRPALENIHSFRGKKYAIILAPDMGDWMYDTIAAGLNTFKATNYVAVNVLGPTEALPSDGDMRESGMNGRCFEATLGNLHNILHQYACDFQPTEDMITVYATGHGTTVGHYAGLGGEVAESAVQEVLSRKLYLMSASAGLATPDGLIPANVIAAKVTETLNRPTTLCMGDQCFGGSFISSFLFNNHCIGISQSAPNTIAYGRSFPEHLWRNLQQSGDIRHSFFAAYAADDYQRKGKEEPQLLEKVKNRHCYFPGDMFFPYQAFPGISADELKDLYLNRE